MAKERSIPEGAIYNYSKGQVQVMVSGSFPVVAWTHATPLEDRVDGNSKTPKEGTFQVNPLHLRPVGCPAKTHI